MEDREMNRGYRDGKFVINNDIINNEAGDQIS